VTRSAGPILQTGTIMSASELELIDRVIGVEGGYADHPADRGGPTRWGITQAVARAYG